MCVGETFLGHHTVFVDEIDQHVPLTTIVGRIRQQEAHESSVYLLAAPEDFNERIQEIVGPFNLYRIDKYEIKRNR